MVRYADWKREPSSPLGWTFLALAEDAPWVALTTAGMVAFVGIVVCFLLGFFPGLGDGWSLQTFRRRTPSSLAPFAAPWGDDYPVRVSVWLRDVRLGSSDAIAVFVDGWLCVEGKRTDFNLRASDALSIVGCTIYLPDGQKAEFEPYDRFEGRHGLISDFGCALHCWHADHVPEGISILPPRLPHPRAQGKARSAALLGFLLVILGVWAIPLGSFLVWAVAAVVGVCGLWRFGNGMRDIIRLSDHARPSSPPQPL